ncbi:MAG TPA: protein phosphatase 2C domain-containing protein [Polyangiaceae bacterium]|jgi:protein phosphatase|nr:protein phosphatase 2C domain-containing protein [Polyangiaceae bacterium]
MSPPDRRDDVHGPASVVVADEPGLSFELALATDVGSERENNEDAFGFFVESKASVVFAVADGVGGYEGGELASRMAIDGTLDSYRGSPAAFGPAKRLARAAQRANIAIYDRAVVVTELSRMATTLTAVAVEGGVLHAVHVGDCRLYLVRDGRITQLTKDHTVAAGRVRLGVLAKEKLRTHPERGTLTRSVGTELIVAVDRLATPLVQGDKVLVASDGLHGKLTDDELAEIVQRERAPVACRALLDAANVRGTEDNLTAVVYTQTGEVAPAPAPGGAARLLELLTAPFRRTTKPG